MVAGCETRNVQVFDMGSRAILRTFDGHTRAVRSTQFTSDGILNDALPCWLQLLVQFSIPIVPSIGTEHLCEYSFVCCWCAILLWLSWQDWTFFRGRMIAQFDCGISRRLPRNYVCLRATATTCGLVKMFTHVYIGDGVLCKTGHSFSAFSTILIIQCVVINGENSECLSKQKLSLTWPENVELLFWCSEIELGSASLKFCRFAIEIMFQHKKHNR